MNTKDGNIFKIPWHEHILHILFPPTIQEEELYRRFLAQAIPPARKSLYPWLDSCASYKSPLIKKIIRQLKNRESNFLSRICAHMIYGKILSLLPQEKINSIIIISIPLDDKRMKERGFNQCHLIAHYIESIYGYKHRTDILHKKPHHKKQALVSDPYARKDNIHGAFTAHIPEDIPLNTPLCIIDDVTTTGATVCEARQVLQHAGFTHIYAITLAH